MKAFQGMARELHIHGANTVNLMDNHFVFRNIHLYTWGWQSPVILYSHNNDSALSAFRCDQWTFCTITSSYTIVVSYLICCSTRAWVAQCDTTQERSVLCTHFLNIDCTFSCFFSSKMYTTLFLYLWCVLWFKLHLMSSADFELCEVHWSLYFMTFSDNSSTVFC